MTDTNPPEPHLHTFQEPHFERDWREWHIVAGRGYGKTYGASRAIKEAVHQHGYRRLCIMAPTYADALETQVRGESGILVVDPSSKLQVNKSQVVWPELGATCDIMGMKRKLQCLRGKRYDLVVVALDYEKFSPPDELRQLLLECTFRPEHGRGRITYLGNKPFETRITVASVGCNYQNLSEITVEYLKKYEGTNQP